jgi:TnpA family transposase
MKSQAKRLSLLSLPEVKEVYDVPQFNARDREIYFSFTDEELDAVKGLHTHRNRIHFLLILGYFKFKKACLTYQWKDIEVDYQYIARRYFPSANKQKQNIDRLTRSRLYQRALIFSNYQRCDKNIESQLLSQLERRAKYYIDETQLFHDAMTFFKSKQVAVPRYSTLQKIISRIINSEETRLSLLINKYLIDATPFLRLIDSKEKNNRLSDLKKLTKALKSGENKKELTRHKLLSELSGVATKVISELKLTEGNIRYFATRCQQYDIFDLRELRVEKSLIYLVCFVATRFRISNDILTLSIMAAYKEFDELAKTYRDEQVAQQSMELAAHIEHVPLLIKLFVDNEILDSTDFGTVRKSAFRIIDKQKMPQVIARMESVKPDKGIFKWAYIDSQFGKVIANLRPLLMALDFGCRDNTILDRQIRSVRDTLTSKEQSPVLDGRLVMRNDKIHLKQCVDDDHYHQKIMANRHEMYLYKLLDQGLRNGAIFVKNSLEYRNFDDYLVDEAIWCERKKYCLDLGLDWMIDSTEAHLDSLESMLDEKIIKVSDRIAEGNNAYIRRKPNADKLLWSRAVIARDDVLTEKFFSHFVQKSIVNVIRKVNLETGFLNHLKPESSRYKKSPANIENLLACLIANGTFQGTHKFSALSDQQYGVLKRIEEDCFYPESLQKSIDTITGSAVTLPIFDDFRLSDGEVHSSADGQRFESKYGNPLVDYSPKYFGKKKGGIVYTLVASHFATQGRVISARSHESHHLFDVVYNNTSDLKTTIVSTDTHGTNQFNHAILNTFGYQFSPRYAKFKHRFLREFTVDFKDGVDLSLTKPINWKLIRSEWDNIIRVMLSLGLRTVQQSTLVKKLCSFKENNSTMRALTEYNRAFKCLHLLDYADDKQLRQVIQESLNSGEQLQGLKRALAALGGNQFRGKSPEEMTRWNGCADLLANCIVYYNAWVMSSFKTYCLETGNSKQLKHLRAISPASWEHILLNGFYDLAENDDKWEIGAEIESLNLAA